jgi:putative endonuclease
MRSKLQTTEPSKTTIGCWFVYILRCADNSLYTGITTDVNKRLNQHNGIDKNGAKYTRGRQPVILVYQESSVSRSTASKREIAIKRLKKYQKEGLINQQLTNRTGN